MKRISQFAALFVLAATVAQAQELTGAQIMEKAFEATGGKKAYDKMKTSVVKGTLSVPMQGLGGTVTTYIKAPNKMMVNTNIDGIGETLQGYDGTTAWAKDPIQGLRKLAGAEKAAMVRGTASASLKWQDHYSKVTLIGKEKVGEKETYVVELVPKVGKPMKNYYDVATFLMLKQTGVQESAMGEMPVETFISDYKDFEGMKIPMKQTMKVGPMEIIIEIKEVKNNVPIDDKIFSMPKS